MVESSGRTVYHPTTYRHFLASVVADYRMTQLVFVAGDEIDRVEAVACPVVAPVG